jgi:hypothetical protein
MLLDSFVEGLSSRFASGSMGIPLLFSGYPSLFTLLNPVYSGIV